MSCLGLSHCDGLTFFSLYALAYHRPPCSIVCSIFQYLKTQRSVCVVSSTDQLPPHSIHILPRSSRTDHCFLWHHRPSLLLEPLGTDWQPRTPSPVHILLDSYRKLCIHNRTTFGGLPCRQIRIAERTHSVHVHRGYIMLRMAIRRAQHGLRRHRRDRLWLGHGGVYCAPTKCADTHGWDEGCGQ